MSRTVSNSRPRWSRGLRLPIAFAPRCALYGVGEADRSYVDQGLIPLVAQEGEPALVKCQQKLALRVVTVDYSFRALPDYLDQLV